MTSKSIDLPDRRWPGLITCLDIAARYTGR
jgi:hypothetical protein